MIQVKKDAIAISLIKGMRVRPEGPQLISAMVQRLLRIDCSVLMGANIAKDCGEPGPSRYFIRLPYSLLPSRDLIFRSDICVSHNTALDLGMSGVECQSARSC